LYKPLPLGVRKKLQSCTRRQSAQGFVRSEVYYENHQNFSALMGKGVVEKEITISKKCNSINCSILCLLCCKTIFCAEKNELVCTGILYQYIGGIYVPYRNSTFVPPVLYSHNVQCLVQHQE
jgi:hypothetical protein